MATPPIFTRSASADMYASFEELAIRMRRAARPLFAQTRTSEGPGNNWDACDGILRRTRSASRQHASYLETAGGMSECSDASSAMRRRSFPQARYEPYAKHHVHFRTDLSFTATSLKAQNALPRTVSKFVEVSIDCADVTPDAGAPANHHDPLPQALGRQVQPAAMPMPMPQDRAGFFKELAKSINAKRQAAQAARDNNTDEEGLTALHQRVWTEPRVVFTRPRHILATY